MYINNKIIIIVEKEKPVQKTGNKKININNTIKILKILIELLSTVILILKIFLD